MLIGTEYRKTNQLVVVGESISSVVNAMHATNQTSAKDSMVITVLFLREIRNDFFCLVTGVVCSINKSLIEMP